MTKSGHPAILRVLLPAMTALAATAASGPASTARGQLWSYRSLDLADYSTETEKTCIARGGDLPLTVVAWHDPAGEILSRSIDELGNLSASTFHGSGRDPALLAVPGGFLLAYAAGSSVFVRAGDGTVWEDPLELSSGQGVSTYGPDLGVFPAAGRVYLVWSEGSQIRFCCRREGIWSAPEVVASNGAGALMSQPEVEPAQDVSGCRPRVYYFTNLWQLEYHEKITGTWTGPLNPPELGLFATEMDAASRTDQRHALLGTPVQPTCPCNEMLFAEELTPGVWSPIEDLTVDQAAYNFPRYPGLAAGPDGRLHAVWYQSFYDEGLQFVGEGLYYRIRTDGTWTVADDVLQGRVGTHCNLALDPGSNAPDFVWVERDGGRWRVIAHVYRDWTAIPGEEPGGARPAFAPTLSAAPSVFTDVARVRYSLPTPAEAMLEILDCAGRPVALLAQGRLAAGDQQASWRGCDRSGRPAPAGIYWVRLTVRGRTLALPLTRLR